MMYTSKLAFLIPHFKEEDGKITAVDYFDFKKYLYDGWGDVGVNYFKVFPVREVIRGTECEADLIVIYCADEMECQIIEVFHEACCKYRDVLDIDYYTFEENDVCVSLRIGCSGV